MDSLGGNIKYLFVVNTIIGRKGNIGYRTKYILSEFESSEVFVISRRGGGLVRGKLFAGIFESVFRGLNAVRIYFWRRFPQKKLEHFLFYMLFRLIFGIHKKKLQCVAVAYCCDMNLSIISYLKRRGIHVILDVPIAPYNYVKKLNYNFGFHLEEDKRELAREVLVINMVDEIIVPSEFVKKEILELNSRLCISLVPFGVNKVPGFIRQTVVDPKRFKFVFAGAISSRKGIKYLLEAWGKISAEYPEIELHLCGRVYPEARAILVSGPKERIVTPGFVDTFEYFKSCDVYVFPSLMEGSSKSVYEAMAMGLPIITTFEAGSIVEDGVEGIIIEKCSATEIYQAMKCFIESGVEYRVMSKCARDKVASYTWGKYSKNVSKLIR